MRRWGFERVGLVLNYSGLTCHCDSMTRGQVGPSDVDHSAALVLGVLGLMLKAKVSLDQGEKTVVMGRRKGDQR